MTLRIWNYARTGDQIQADMQTTLAGNEPGLLGYWGFNEPTNSQIVLDHSPNANNGQLGSTTGIDSDDPTRVASTRATYPVSVAATSSVGFSTYGQTLTLTATVSAAAPASGTPSGTVTFYDGATSLSAPTTLANGTVTFTTSDLNAAIHTITAVYSGDTCFTGNTGLSFQAVNKAVLTVAADSMSRAYGDPNPTFTASYTGFKNGETLAASGVTGDPSLSCTATTTSPVGTYTIVTGSGTLAANNYTFAFVNGTLFVTNPPDTTPPTVSIAAVTPNPRPSPVDSIAIQFSEPVVGFGLEDLQLTLGGVSLPLNGATLTTSDQRNWTLGNLSATTSPIGNYQLTLAATGSGITDLAGNALTVGANVTWQTQLPLAGDFNLDGTVDGLDLDIWMAHVGITSGATFQMGDANHDGAVNGLDIDLLEATMGMVLVIDTTAPTVSIAAVTPNPR